MKQFNHDFILQLEEHSGPANKGGPLSGVTVIDLTHYVAGPLATMLLADMGATVIKIEPPGGDGFRAYPPHNEAHPDEGAPYLWANRNKLGVEVDLKHIQGNKLIHALLKNSDVLVENFAAGVMERLGLGYDILSKRYPKLIYCSISAYGRNGKFSNKSGLDTVVQAESGFVSMNGYNDRPGVRTSSPVMDIGTALCASNGILSALYKREKENEGQYVEVSLYSSAILMNGYAAMQTLCTGVEPERRGNTSSDSCPTGVFECQDASFFLHCPSNDIFKRLMVIVLNLPTVAEEAAYASAYSRLNNRESLFTLLKREFKRYTWAELRIRLENAKVPAGEIRGIKSALLSEESSSNKLIGRIRHSTLGWIPNIRMPVTINGDLMGVNPKAAPTRGEDTLTVLTDIAGYDDTAVHEALESGAFFIPENALGRHK